MFRGLFPGSRQWAAPSDLVLDRIQAIPGVQTTRTWLVFDELPGPGADWS